MTAYWGIDLGGTKIEGAVLDSLERAEPVSRLRVDTEQDGGYEHILSQIARLVEMLAKEVGAEPETLGIGHPGVLDPRTNLLKNSNTQCLNGKPLKSDLEALLALPIRLANDANCFALAETIYGAAKGSDVVFGVIMGTGVGGGIVVNRRALYGAQGIAGEWGHNVIDPSGPACYCGKRGCVEAMISGPALERFYETTAGKKMRLPAIISAARAGADEAAAATLDHLLRWFGRSIAVVINILDPDCVVLGGGLSNISELYTDGRAVAAEFVINDRLDTRIEAALLGDSAGVFGAATLTARI